MALQEYKWIAYVKMCKIVNTQTKKNHASWLEETSKSYNLEYLHLRPKIQGSSKFIPLYQYKIIPYFQGSSTSNENEWCADNESVTCLYTFVCLCVHASVSIKKYEKFLIIKTKKNIVLLLLKVVSEGPFMKLLTIH